MNGNRSRYKLLIIDIICLNASLFIAYYIRHQGNFSYLLNIYKNLFFVCTVIDIVLFFFLDPFYHFYDRGILKEFSSTVFYTTSVMLSVLLWFYFVNSANDYSRLIFALTYFFYLFISFGARCIYKKLTSKKEYLQGNADSLFVICDSKDVLSTIEYINRFLPTKYTISGISTIDKKKIFIEDYLFVPIEESSFFVLDNNIDEIYIIGNVKNISKTVLNELSLTRVPLSVVDNDLIEIKNQIPSINIMGVNLAAINMDWLIEFTKKNIQELSGKYICVTNVYAATIASEDERYRRIQNRAVMAIPDGGPLSFVGRRRGYPEMSRTTGPDYMGEMFKISVENGYKHFFYGSSEETIEKLRKELQERYPGIDIVGMYSPPYRELTKEEDKQVIEMINKTDPDFVWVGLGAPKQERWMYKHQNKVKGLMVGVGAGFDYYAGNISRAPMWMQKMNLEWLYRLIQEPRRLFKKYLVTNTKFIIRAIIRGR